jgi:hypothetical protein
MGPGESGEIEREQDREKQEQERRLGEQQGRVWT